MRIKFNKLILSGEEKDYIVTFKDGLNFITGPISTGKSTILELLDYCLGKKNHKDYTEVKLTCKYVSLDITINGERILIERPLFSFDLPVKYYQWDENINSFSKIFGYLIVSSPNEDNSLSRFLNEKLGIPEFKLSGQSFSFRDIYKYCYIGQTKIDSENILEEKNYTYSFKRKPTLDIIFNSLNLLLQELKNDEKSQREAVNSMLDRKIAIISFLREVELFSTNDENEKTKASLIIKKNELQQSLYELKTNGKIENNNTKSIEDELFSNRRKLTRIDIDLDETQNYLIKLDRLRNQYFNEIIKIDYLIISNGRLQNIEFHSCPSCSTEVEVKDYDVCNLCGQELTEFNDEEEKAIKTERKRLNSKLTSLIEFINNQNQILVDLTKKKVKLTSIISELEVTINNIQKEFISPFIEKIEKLNRDIGEVSKQIENLNLSLNVQSELLSLADNIQSEENKLDSLRKQIKDILEDNTDMPDLMAKLSVIFEKTLKAFNFPKLTTAYIDTKTYLPFVRNIKYDSIGSLGAVTLINIAYFLSILELSLKLKKSYHPKVLIFDTIGKNLGTRESAGSNDEFKDSKIFKSLLVYLKGFAEKYKDKMQLIIVNNDYTDDIVDTDIIVKFDGDGTKGIDYGLITDITS